MVNDRAAVEMAHGLAALDPFEVARVLLNLDETITRE